MRAADNSLTLKPLPLTRERFSAYGNVIESPHTGAQTMNDARFDRFDDLCEIDIPDGRVAVSIAVSRTASVLPYLIDMVERHPHGSQAFMPLSVCKMIVVVAEPNESVEASDLRAFISNGHQGVNYHRGTWHMPLIALQPGQRYLVIDRATDRTNCDEHTLDTPVMLVES